MKQKIDGTIVGTAENLEDIIPQLSEYFVNSSFKISEGQIFISTNPDLQVWWDSREKLLARGTNNCINCKFYSPYRYCQKTRERIDQEFILKHDIGGCVFHEYFFEWEDPKIQYVLKLSQTTNLLILSGNIHKLDT